MSLMKSTKSLFLSVLTTTSFCSTLLAQDLSSENKTSKNFGVDVSVTRDLSTEVKAFGFGDSEYAFTSAGYKGLTALNLFMHVYSGSLDFSFGVMNYLPTHLSSPSNHSASRDVRVSSQSFEMLGLRLINVGYTILPIKNLEITNGAGLNIYYGKNSVDLKSERYNSTNNLSLEKGIAAVQINSVVSYRVASFFAPYLSLALELPRTVVSEGKQTGDWSYINLDKELDENLDFKNNVGVQIAVGTTFSF
jgi:hypothetical protein